MSKFTGINVGHVNVYHLGNKTHDICRLLNESNLDILGLSETRLNLQPDEQIEISDFTFFRKDKQNTGQHGLGAYINNSVLPFTERRMDLESNNVENMWIQVKRSPKDTPLLICFMYRNCSSDFTWYDDFFTMMTNVYNKHPKANILILGDFNLDLLKPQVPWLSTYTSVGLQQLISNPTRVAKKGDRITSTLLDHIYTNQTHMVSNIKFSDIRVSDHTAIICTWNCKIKSPQKQPQNHTTIEYRCFKNFDQNRFLFDLSLCDFSTVYQYSDPNMALKSWYDIFLPLLNKHAPIRKKRVKQKQFNESITPDILNLMRERDKLYNDGRHEEYRKLRNKVNDMIRQSEAQLIQSKVEKSKHIGTIWNAMDYITHKHKKKKLFNNISASANEFNSIFLSSNGAGNLTSPTVNNTPVDLHKVKDFCKSKLSSFDSCVIPEMTVFEVGKHLQSLSDKKSTGIDSVSPFFIKLSLPYIVESLTYIYNLCITSNTFPDEWKKAKVVPIPKTKNCSDLNNFRPISILSVLSKPIEKHIHVTIYEFLEQHKLFHELQSGFRKGHSCNTALTSMCDSWLSSINESLICGAIFLDFRKAFDLVNHQILGQKVNLYTNNKNTSDFITSFLNDRSQQVLLNGEYSMLGYLTRGVPQGSILGPLLFCLYINDLPLHISNPNVSCYLFADDGTLSASAKSAHELEIILQKEIDNISCWSKSNHMTIHPDKTKAMLLTCRQKHQLNPLKISITINNKAIELVDHHKVLGVIIDNDMRWESHINQMCSKVSRNLYLLFKLKPYIDLQNMKNFYHAHCLSHFNYCSTVWSKASDVLLKKANRLHRRAANLLLPSETMSTDNKFQKLGILSLNKQFRYNTLVMMFNAHLNEGPTYLSKLLNISNRRHRYLIPVTRIDLYKASFSFQGPSLWNSLPMEIRQCRTLASFKSQLRKSDF